MTLELCRATGADDAAIRGLLRREPVPGRIAISYLREPEFALGCAAMGEDTVTLVARDAAAGAVVAVACRSTREVFLNGEARRIGYLGQLRIDGRYRGRWLLSRGYALLRELDRDVPGYLAAVTPGNREALGVLVEKPRRRFPVFHPVADYVTLALRVPRVPAVAPAVPPALDELIAFLREHGARRQFAPVWTAERLAQLPGLRLDAFEAIRDGHGGLAGVAALWDQSGFKQNVVHSYSGWMRVVRPIRDVAARWLGRPPLPDQGERIRSAYAAFVHAADAAGFEALIERMLARARARDLHFLLLGLDRRDPLLPAARRFAHVPYPSRMYVATWPEEESLHARLDARPSAVEIATL